MTESSSVSWSGPKSITLTPYFQKQYIDNHTVGFRMRVEVSEASGMPSEIFRYYQGPTNRETGAVMSQFTGVCSWPDLEELPAGAPDTDTNPQGFRLDYFDIVVRSQSIAQDVWEHVQQEVSVLCETMRNGEELEAGQPVTLGAP